MLNTDLISFLSLFLFMNSGYANDNIIRVLQGDRIGTVFHQDAHLWTLAKEESAREKAVAARESSRKLRVLNPLIFCFNYFY